MLPGALGIFSSPLPHTTRTSWRTAPIPPAAGGTSWLDRSLSCRGGAAQNKKTEPKASVFHPLAQALLPYLSQDLDATLTTDDVTSALQALASSQQTFKGLDGMAHEAYQRTHTGEDISLHVSGRALRTVARTTAVALGLGACELCELVSVNEENNDDEALLQRYRNGTLADKQVLLRETITGRYHKKTSLNVTLLVLHQPDYRGGAGVEHGNLFGERPSRICRGRLLIVLGTADTSIPDMLQVLGLPAQLVALRRGHEAASVQPLLYRAASQVLHRLENVAQPYNTSAIHIVGHSLAGGVATLLATMLEGHVAPSKTGAAGSGGKSKPKKDKIKRQNRNSTATEDSTDDTTMMTVGPGWGRGRTSAVVLGAPPSMSANVPTETLVTSIVYGDDWVSRTTESSLKRLLARVQPILKRRKSILTKQVALLGDTVKLATQGFTAHAHGREGEESRLTSMTGSQAYLLRPRRYGNQVSIHEMGRSSGREAIRAAVLWQLSDILLSPSYAKHHTLDSYIHGLDRVHVRGLDDGKQDGEEQGGLEEWNEAEKEEEEDEENAEGTEEVQEDAKEEEDDDDDNLQEA